MQTCRRHSPAGRYNPVAYTVSTVLYREMTIKEENELKQMLKNRKAVALLLLVAMLFSIMPTAVWANEPASVATTNAYVTIVKDGEFVSGQDSTMVSHIQISVTDENANGYVDIDDVLYTAHKSWYPGGASAGYGSEKTQYGLSLSKLWGDTSYGFGYYVNDASAWSLEDAVKDDDHVVAFIYQDQKDWSDVYAYFHTDAITVTTGSQLTLQLNGAYYGAISSASITIDGQDCGKDTDEFGVVTLSFDQPGTYQVSATSSMLQLVAPICNVTVKDMLSDADAVAIGKAALEKQSPIVLSTNDTDVHVIAQTIVNKRTIGVKIDNSVTSNDAAINNNGQVVSYDVTSKEVSVTFALNKGNATTSATVTFQLPTKAEKSAAKVDIILDKIASGYTEQTGEWIIMDMAAYTNANPYSYYKTSATAKQAYINKTIQSVIDSNATETSYSKAIIALTSLGIDPTKLYPVNSNTPINAVDKLSALQHSSSAWVAPYTLAAYQQGNYDTATQETELISSILAIQAEDGSWTEWGDSIQTTSNIIAGLAFYYNTDETVKAAVDKAIVYLASAQKTDGTFDAYGYGADANTAAMVVIALASVGINPETDARFVKNGVSALDGLLQFALADNSGFGHENNTTLNELATEQGFRALIAASQVMKTGQAYNVYDFSGNVNSLQPGRATGSGIVAGPSTPSSSDKIIVTMGIRADKGYWMRDQSIQVAKDATVYHAFVEALKKNNMTQYGAESGYVRSITYNGRTLEEFDLGPNSGWLYQVNGTLPNVGLLEYPLEDGDTILWYYTADWTKDPQAGAYNKKEEDKTDKNDQTNTALSICNIFSDVSNHWAARAIQFVYDTGLMRGISDTNFAPEATFTRGMMATILHRLEGMPSAAGTIPFLDVTDRAWYSAAVTWAYQNNLAGGVSDTSYAPESPITREQLVVMLMRYAQSKGYDIASGTSLSQYQDCSQVSDYAKSAMEWAVSIGLIAGRSDTILAAQDSVTRAEVAVLLERFLTLFPILATETTAETK